MAELSRDSLKMICTGISLGLVNDIRVKGKFPFLQNIRIFTEGVLEARPILNPFLTLSGGPLLGEVPHSIKTIIDKTDDTFLRIVGNGTRIHTGAGAALPVKVTGLSGKPLFMVDFRPEESVETHVYIADENKFVKISASDVLSDVGIVAPNKAPIFTIGTPERKIVDAIGTGSNVDWNNLTGSAGAPTLQTRVNQTVTQYIADGALPNFASIIPNALPPGLQRGSILIMNGVDNRVVEEVLPSALATGLATISKISYDAGATGDATIVLSVSNKDIRRNSILFLNGTEYVRVKDVTYDTNGIPSVRVTTIGTFIVGNTISGIDSFRIYTTGAYAAAQTIFNEAIRTVIGAAGVSSITRTFNTDLTNTGTKALSDDAVLHCSLLVSNPANITEIQIQLDVNSGAQNFLENYYYYVLNPNFFTGSVAQTTPTISVIQQVIQRRELLNRDIPQYGNYGGYQRYNLYGLDESSPADIPIFEPETPTTTSETTLGQAQWTEVEIKLADLIRNRVGSDLSRTLKDVKAIRISVTAIAPVDVYLDSIWVGGADALTNSTEGFLPYNYVWRIRDPATRVRSNWSPPIRTGIKISNGRVKLTFPDAVANYPAGYVIDIARVGGTLNDFRIIGTITNNGTEYVDTSSDRVVSDNALAGRFSSQGSTDAVFDFYKPFAVLDTRKTGTCDIIGTKFVWISGDKLNISYPRGTQIVINGLANKFYNSPTSIGAANAAEKVELERDMGSLVGVNFEIKEPLLTGQPLPVIFGPFGEGTFGLIMFGVGDRNAAGTLYWLDGNSPDTQSDLNRLEITSPSEPLMTGVMYDSYGIIFTTKRTFTIIPTFNEVNGFSFIARQNAGSRGIYARHTLCTSFDNIYFLSENADGIYKVKGNGTPTSITAGSIANMFYNNSKMPATIKLVDGTEIFPPDFSAIEELRLFSVKDYLFFRFRDMQGKDRCLVFSEAMNDWISYDVYINDKINGIYYEEKESSKVILAGIPDAIAKFDNIGNYETLQLVKVVPSALDGGDSQLIKEWKEEIVSVNPGLGGLTVRNYYDNGDFNDPFEPIAGLAIPKRTKNIISLQNSEGVGVLAFNITPIFEWRIDSGVKLYEIMTYWIPQGDEITDRSADTDFAESIGAKWWQGVVIEANTFGQDKVLNYYNDRNELKASITINHDGMETRSYSFPIPFISHTIRRTSEDGIDWLVKKEVYIYDNEPEQGKVWEGQFNTSDLTGLLLIQRFGISYRSTAITSLKIISQHDGTINEYFLPSTNGEHDKIFFFAKTQKAEAYKYRFESTEDLTLYKRDCEVWIKSVTSSQPFQRIMPFGGLHRATEILI